MLRKIIYEFMNADIKHEDQSLRSLMHPENEDS